MLRKALPALVVTLLLANGAMLAAQLGAFGAEPLGGWAESPREPARPSRQVRAERMKLLAPAKTAAISGATAGSAPAAKAAPPAGTVKGAASSAQAAPASAVVATTASTAATSTSPAGCLEIGGFSPQALRHVVDVLAGDKALQVEQFERQEQVRWWVHLQPQPTREDVDRKLAELRRRNVTDYAIVPVDGFTISLGVFRERERAEQYLGTLREHGVRTAVVSDAPRGVSRQWLRVREDGRAGANAVQTRLEDLRQRYGAEEVAPCRA